MTGVNIQKEVRSKYAELFFLRIERDKGLRWETEEPTPVIISDDFFYALGTTNGYLTNVAKHLKGDFTLVEHLQDFIQIVVASIGDYEESIDYEVPSSYYQGYIKINDEAKEFEMTFEYLTNHFYISLEKVDTANIYMLMENLS